MKKMLLVLILSLGGLSTAFAEGFECVSNDEAVDGKVLIRIPDDGNPVTMTVEIGGVVVYRDVAVVQQHVPDREGFQSPQFINQKHAPASLHFTIYNQNGVIYGQFSETSFIPFAPNFGTECKHSWAL